MPECNTPLSFVDCIFHYLRGQDDMADVVREWVETEPDVTKRECGFACRLAEDLESQYRSAASSADADTQVMGQLILLVSSHCNWRMIARRLLRHFSRPEVLAYPKSRVAGYSTAAWN